jgi:hypothetical protein
MIKMEFTNLCKEYIHYKKINNLSFKEKMLEIETIKNHGYDSDSNQINTCFWLSIKDYLKDKDYSVNFLQKSCWYQKKNEMFSFNDKYDIKCARKLCSVLDATIYIYTLNIIDGKKYVNPSSQYKIGYGKNIIRIAHFNKPVEHFELIEENKNHKYLDITDKIFNRHEKKIKMYYDKKNVLVFKSKVSEKFHIKKGRKSLCNKRLYVTKDQKKILLHDNRLCKKCLYFFG